MQPQQPYPPQLIVPNPANSHLSPFLYSPMPTPMQQNGFPIGNYWLLVSHIYQERVIEKQISPLTWRKEYEQPYKQFFQWLHSPEQQDQNPNQPPSTKDHYGKSFNQNLSTIVSFTQPTTPRDIENICTGSPLVSVDLLDVIKFLRQIPANTRKRKRYYVALKMLWDVANLSTVVVDEYGRVMDLTKFSGNYSLGAVNPRSLPSDEMILETAAMIKDKKPDWYYAYCYLAIYGLRNTELLTINYDDYPNLFVYSSKTKKSRYVLPFHSHWVDELKIPSNIKLPHIRRKDSHGFSHAVTTLFRNLKLTFRPKDLRHCYARRTTEANYPALYAAKLMGHSVKVHESTYLNFIGLDSYLKALN